MAADDDAVRARMRELEAEVAATSAADRARKDAARERIVAKRAAAAAESDELRRRQAALVTRRRTDDDGGVDGAAPSVGDLGRAVALAKRAGDVKAELARKPGAGEKSWLISAGLSFFFGPLGWLYAGALRETIPIATIYLLVAAVVSKIIPMFLLMPVMMVLLPLSAIGGLVYAIGHNRAGHRVRLFGEEAKEDRRAGGLLGRGRERERE